MSLSACRLPPLQGMGYAQVPGAALPGRQAFVLSWDTSALSQATGCRNTRRGPGASYARLSASIAFSGDGRKLRTCGERLRCAKVCGSRRRSLQCVMEVPSDTMLRQPSQDSTRDGPRELGNGAHTSSAAVPRAAQTGKWRVLPDMWRTLAERHGSSVALYDPHRGGQEITYQQLEQSILDFAEGLKVYGVEKGQCVALFSDNSHKWVVADQGIMAAGASDAVRGAKAPAPELVHITAHSDSCALVAETVDVLSKVVRAMKESPQSAGLLSQLKFAVLLWGGDKPDAVRAEIDGLGLPFEVHMYEDVLGTGRTSRSALAAADGAAPVSRPGVLPQDVATLVYTSGTGGNPKGVQLTHANLLHQVLNFDVVIGPEEGDRTLSLLPPWHMYERSTEYFVLSRGAKQVYSSVKTFKEDLSTYPPHFFIAVPLVFDILYNGVQKKLAAASATKAAVAKYLLEASYKYMDARRVLLGLSLAAARKQETLAQAAAAMAMALVTWAVMLPLHLLAKKVVYSKVRAALDIQKAAVCGGGALAPHVDRFFEAIGIMVLNGYGLTETSPVLTVRRPEKNVLGSVGTPLPHTEVKVVDQETGQEVPRGVKGIVKARGPQVTQGYYKNPAYTAATFDEEGFFNTGDLGWIAPGRKFGSARNCGGALVLDGRAKDTIVLANGENIEPASIEEAVVQSKLVQQIMLVGQDKKRLGALIVTQEEELEAAVQAALSNGSSQVPREEVRESLIRAEVNRCLTATGHTASHERIGPFFLLSDAFTVDNGLLTSTLKMKRDVITKTYESEIASLFAKQ